jgi:Arc/MetJ family transcription regulator
MIVRIITTLLYMYESCIFIHMRTTLNIDDDLLKKASRLSGVVEKTSLVKLGLEALIARESARRLADLGGSEKKLKNARRRREVHSDARRYFRLG